MEVSGKNTESLGGSETAKRPLKQACRETSPNASSNSSQATQNELSSCPSVTAKRLTPARKFEAKGDNLTELIQPPTDLVEVEKKLVSLRLNGEGSAGRDFEPDSEKTVCNGTCNLGEAIIAESKATPSKKSPSVELVGTDTVNGSSAPGLQESPGCQEHSNSSEASSKPGTDDEQSRQEDPEVPGNGDLPDETGIRFIVYTSEVQMPAIMELMSQSLSEPYSIYTYRYFIHNWPKLCFLAKDEEGQSVGAIVCKLDTHKQYLRRGYIAMLAVHPSARHKGIGTKLVKRAIHAMTEDDCDEVVLETEVDNKAALRLYENLGFVRDKRLFKYYLNGVDAFRLKLWLR